MAHAHLFFFWYTSHSREQGLKVSAGESFIYRYPPYWQRGEGIWSKFQFWSHNSIQMYQMGTFCQSKRLIGAVLSISENLRSKGQKPSLPYDQIWAKLQFWIHNSFQCTRWQLLSMEKTYWDSVKHFWKFEGHKWKSSDDQIWTIVQFWSHQSILKYQVAIFVNWKHLITGDGQCWAFMKIWGSKVKVTRWPSTGKNAVLEPHALYKGGF